MSRANKKIAKKPWNRTGTKRNKIMIQDLRVQTYDRPRIKHWDYLDDDDDSYRDDSFDWDDDLEDDDSDDFGDLFSG